MNDLLLEKLRRLQNIKKVVEGLQKNWQVYEEQKNEEE